MAAHTPGPWEMMGRFTIIAQGYVVAVCDRGTEVPGEANAYLITTAPDLRRFAQEIAALGDWEGYTPAENLELLQALQRQAQQLVAKADGAT